MVSSMAVPFSSSSAKKLIFYILIMLQFEASGESFSVIYIFFLHLKCDLYTKLFVSMEYFWLFFKMCTV